MEVNKATNLTFLIKSMLSAKQKATSREMVNSEFVSHTFCFLEQLSISLTNENLKLSWLHDKKDDTSDGSGKSLPDGAVLARDGQPLLILTESTQNLEDAIVFAQSFFTTTHLTIRKNWKKKLTFLKFPHTQSFWLQLQLNSNFLDLENQSSYPFQRNISFATTTTLH